ncbi:uncharacterized protein LOC111716887 [Eurytemora carolleeae]|uniref:uncharacterized protein LOC111716887 n=1 Tax=Eurytemora carolleeae TaxID=1294199 RepID=UPI000C75B372|nr:uncharacterized protein LOC111716887 [Eurytemora carolleeae]|eukprot:XP_023348172.1 uncharacterized protein LOC111716887 [Eurytemora affinis]
MYRIISILAVIISKISCLYCYKNDLYKTYRLEKLCRGDGGKVGIVINDVVSAFFLNSSLVPGETFNCHVEMVVRSANTGFFVYFEEMNLSESTLSGCNEDFVQFGRDILFVTSHLSKKYCGRMEKVSLSHCDKNRTEPTPTLKLGERIYSEERDREMDIWIRLSVPAVTVTSKTVTLVVTPFKKACSANDLQYRKCGNSPRCIRKELFCDGQINCAVTDNSPEDERNCSWMGRGIEEPKTWKSQVPFLEGFLFLLVILLIVLIYIGVRVFRRRKLNKGEYPAVREQRDLIQFNSDQYRECDTVVPVSAPSCPPLPLPPPYSQIDSSTVIQYSYANR